MYKDHLIQRYVNLYRAVNWTNEGLSTAKLEKMSITDLEKGIYSLLNEHKLNEHYSNM